MRIVLVGSVNSSSRTLRKLIEHNLAPVAVFGYRAPDTSHVSAYENLEPLAQDAGIVFHPFQRINDHVDELSQYKPDLIFVIGLSQLVTKKIIELPTYGCVGFHPTALPLGRGRAPLAWIILDDCPAAATYFQIAEGMDDGPIYAQIPFDVDSTDDALSVTDKLLAASEQALDRWLPELAKGKIGGIEQDHKKATYYGKRIESDGHLAWLESASSLDRLVRATTNPYPGAYTQIGELKIRVWNATITHSLTTGVPGSIVELGSDKSFIVQTGCGHLKILNYTVEGGSWTPAVGRRFDTLSGLSWPRQKDQSD